MDDEDRFNAETGEEARYWFCVSEFAELSFKHGCDKMFSDVLDLRLKKWQEREERKLKNG
jgi:hypothetical protein